MKQKNPIFVIVSFGFLVISLILHIFDFAIMWHNNSTLYLVYAVIRALICLAISISVMLCCFLLKNKLKNVNVSIVYLVAQVIIALLCLTGDDSLGVYLLCLIISAIGILINIFDLSQNGITISQTAFPTAQDVAGFTNDEATANLEKLKELKDSGVLTEEEFAEKSKQYIDYL